jgi:hypothetical protein
MLTHPTLEQMRALKLDDMAEAFVELEGQDAARDLCHAEWLALLLDREAAHRASRRFETRLRKARLRHSQASIEDVDYRTPRRLDKALFQSLATCRWVAEHRGLLVSGPHAIHPQTIGLSLVRHSPTKSVVNRTATNHLGHTAERLTLLFAGVLEARHGA